MTPATTKEQPKPGSRLSRQISLRYVMTHPVAFRRYWAPKVSKRRFWHRHNFTPPLLAIEHGDTLLRFGRGSGKSFAVLEPELVRQAVNRRGEETLLTSFRRLHTSDRMERAIDYFELIPFFRLYLSRVLRSPQYMVQLRNGHVLYGISVGDDPEAKMAQGKHASSIIIEESQQYPLRAFIKLDGAQDPRGCRFLMVGVPDGRLDTPFRLADSRYRSFEGRRIQISRRHDPYWDAKTKQKAIDKHGSEDADTFGQEVDAEHGHPTWSAWDLEAIQRCIEPKDCPVVVHEISGKVYHDRGLTPSTACAELPGPTRSAPRMLAADIGYSQPTMILIFEFWHERWWLIARVKLTNRMEHDDQARVMDEIGRRYDVTRIGVDTTEGEGRAIAQELETNLGWSGRVDRVMFTETHTVDWKTNENGEIEEVTNSARSIATIALRSMFRQKTLALPNDEEIPGEFNQEMESRSADGQTRVHTPSTVHVTDACRVFSMMLFLANPPRPPDNQQLRVFVLPEMGGPSVWTSRAAQMVF